MAQLAVRLLGRFEVRVNGRLVPDDAWVRRAAQLVALLVLAPGRRLARDQILDALWPRLTPDSASANLHKAAHHARKALDARDAIVLRGGLVELWPGATLEVDAERFEALAKRALDADDRQACARAAREYRGELLPAERYEDWAIARRDYLRGLHLRLLKHAGRWEEVLAHEPLDEEAHRALIREYAERGNRLAARYQFRHLRDLLAREHLQPAPETVNLYREISLAPVAEQPLVPPPIAYLRSSGFSIAYQVVEGGPADLLMIPGWISHLALDWEEPHWLEWCEQMTRFARLIRFDKRGTGLSDRPPGPQPLEERAEDARAVLDAAGVERAHVLGWSEGGPLALFLAASHPERVLSLVLYGTQACFRREPDYPWGFTDEEREEFSAGVEREWGELAFASFLAPAGDEAFVRRWAAYQRAGASPTAAADLNDMNLRLDARSLLPRIKVPTLVVNRRGDPVAPVEAGRYVAEHIENARFVELQGDSHVMWVGDVEALAEQIRRFISEVEAGRAGQATALARKVSGRRAS